MENLTLKNKYQLIEIGKLKKYKYFYADLFRPYESLDKMFKISIHFRENFIFNKTDTTLNFLVKNTNNINFIEDLIKKDYADTFSNPNLNFYPYIHII